MKEVRKEISVTVTVRDDGTVSFDFAEAECGDTNGITTTIDELHSVVDQVGWELGSWAMLMSDELEED